MPGIRIKQQELKQQVINYDRIAHIKNTNEKHLDQRNLMRSGKKYNKSSGVSPLTNQRLRETYNKREDSPINDAEQLPSFKRELQKPTKSRPVSRKEPVSEIKNRKKTPRLIAREAVESDIPIKKHDAKNSHPKSKKYKEIQEKFKEKLIARNTEYQKSYIAPEEAFHENEVASHNRAKTQDKRLKQLQEERTCFHILLRLNQSKK